jgi:hypothetical protein
MDGNKFVNMDGNKFVNMDGNKFVNMDGNKFVNMDGNELVLIYPYVLDIPKNEEKIYSLVNSLLLILHDTYAEQIMSTKKEIILTTLEMYKNKINVNKDKDNVNKDKDNVNKNQYNVNKNQYNVNKNQYNVNKNQYNVNKNQYNVDSDFKKIIFEIANISNINIITIDSLNLSTLYKCENNNKYIILINIFDNYYPIYNFSVGYYTSESIFLNYILSLSSPYTYIDDAKRKENDAKRKENDANKKENDANKKENDANKKENDANKKDNDVKKKSKKEECTSKIEDGQYYDEVITNEDYSLYVSDIVPKKAKGGKVIEMLKTIDACEEGNKTGKGGENGSDKKKKNSKNIFIKDNDETDEVFNKSEAVNYIELKKMFTKASKLEEIRTIAIKLGVPIVSGSTKEGKPKNRVKNDIVNDINKLFSMMIV